MFTELMFFFSFDFVLLFFSHYTLATVTSLLPVSVSVGTASCESSDVSQREMIQSTQE